MRLTSCEAYPPYAKAGANSRRHTRISPSTERPQTLTSTPSTTSTPLIGSLLTLSLGILSSFKSLHSGGYLNQCELSSKGWFQLRIPGLLTVSSQITLLVTGHSICLSFLPSTSYCVTEHRKSSVITTRSLAGVSLISHPVLS
jgi:hypothetical protein